MKIAIQMLSVGVHEIHFFFNESYDPLVEIDGMECASLKEILIKLPELKEEKYFHKFAQLIIFLTKGLEFELIDSPGQINQEENETQFDLSAIEPPKLFNRIFVFFAKHDYLGSPYKVTFDFQSHLTRYDLLEALKE